MSFRIDRDLTIARVIYWGQSLLGMSFRALRYRIKKLGIE